MQYGIYTAVLLIFVFIRAADNITLRYAQFPDRAAWRRCRWPVALG